MLAIAQEITFIIGLCFICWCFIFPCWGYLRDTIRYETRHSNQFDQIIELSDRVFFWRLNKYTIFDSNNYSIWLGLGFLICGIIILFLLILMLAYVTGDQTILNPIEATSIIIECIGGAIFAICCLLMLCKIGNNIFDICKKQLNQFIKSILLRYSKSTRYQTKVLYRELSKK